MYYTWLADAIVAIHVAYVAFVILGQAAILLGAALRWNWIRDRAFRLLHLLTIVIVAAEALLEIPCPLTVAEAGLRSLAGQQSATGSFIGHWLHELLFFDLPPWVFTLLYVSFALVTILSLVLIPPRWRTHARVSL